MVVESGEKKGREKVVKRGKRMEKLRSFEERRRLKRSEGGKCVKC